MIALEFAVLSLISNAAALDHISSSVDYGIEDNGGNAMVTSIAQSLQLTSDNPCDLMPYVEVSSLSVVDQLQAKLKMENSLILTEQQLKETKNIYYELGLFAESYTMCLISSMMGQKVAANIADQWVSGYHERGWKLNTRSHFAKAIQLGQGQSYAFCLSSLRQQLDNGEFQAPDESVYKSFLDNLKKSLDSLGTEASKITAGIESVAVRCLDSTPGLSEYQKKGISKFLGKGSALFRRMEGSVLRKSLPDDQTLTKLTSLVAGGINNAQYLTEKEKARRVRFMQEGELDRNSCKLKKNYKDCMLYTAEGISSVLNA